jgi:hypothetical protein
MLEVSLVLVHAFGVRACSGMGIASGGISILLQRPYALPVYKQRKRCDSRSKIPIQLGRWAISCDLNDYCGKIEKLRAWKEPCSSTCPFPAFSGDAGVSLCAIRGA